jgi:hypothetical protein
VIIQERGRWRTERTPEEQVALTRDLATDLNEQERAAFNAIMSQITSTGKSLLVDEVARVDWQETPVPIEEWLNSEELIGDNAKSMFPKLKEDMIKLFRGSYHEVVLTGCIDQDAIVMCSDGSMPRLGDLIGRKTSVLTVDETTGIDHADSTEGVDSGVRQVLDLTLDSGMRVRLTPDHRVLTTRGWVPAAHLKDTDWVLRPRSVTYTPSMTNLRDEEVKLLAYWVTDGSSSATRARYCDDRIETGREVISCLRRLGYSSTTAEPYAKNGAWEVHVAKCATSGFRDWLDRHKILGVGAAARVVPDAICRAPLNQVALFLNRVWAAEGTISSTSTPRFQLGMKSERFIRQVQLLLLRWGIQSRIYRTTSQRHGTECVTWLLAVSGASNLRAFVKEIGVVFSKETECTALLATIEGKKANTNVDVVPLTWGEANDELQDAAQTLDRSPETVFYDRIKSLVPVETRIPVADIGVPGPMRFTANGITVHNSIGWGKDYFACFCLMRLLYELCCMKNPARTLGLGAGEQIHIAPVSRTVELAKRVVFSGVLQKLRLAPWFKGRFHETQDYIQFKDKNILIVGGSSSDTSILGLNILAAILDELNFHGAPKKKDALTAGGHSPSKAQMIYDALVRRVKSRYERSGIKGMVFLVSSKRATTDFTEVRIRESMKARTDRGLFVMDYATWHVLPGPFKDQKWHRATLSPSDGRVTILEDNEPEPSGLLVFDFPDDYLSEFLRDPIGATRDVAGLATDAVSPFIPDRDAIDEMFDEHMPCPFLSPTWNMGHDLPIKWSDVMTQNARGENIPICCPAAPRHVHIDLSENQCATGWSMMHQAGTIEVKRLDPETGKMVVEEMPVIHMDGILRIVAPQGGSIDHAGVRNLVYRFVDAGFYVRSVSMDQWMSVPNKQAFERRGLQTEVISTVRTLDPYIAARSAVIERRIKGPPCLPLKNEVIWLELNETGRKIVAPPNGTKDVADSWAGAIFYIANNAIAGNGTMSVITDRREAVVKPPVRLATGGQILWEDEEEEEAAKRDDTGGLGSFIIR